MMEETAREFIIQFSATLFTQWAKQTSDKQPFWIDLSCLQNILESGIAKLPNVPVKGHLTRELSNFTRLLQSDLEKRYSDSEPTDVVLRGRQFLLNEEDVEKALATSTPNERIEIDSILGLDASCAMQLAENVRNSITRRDTAALLDCVEQTVSLIHVMMSRGYASSTEQQIKQNACLQQIYECVRVMVEVWCVRMKDHEYMRVWTLLQSLLVVSQPEQWTSFYRPSEAKDSVFESGRSSEGMSLIYGALLGLALSCPIHNEEDEDEDTSDSSSSEDEHSSKPMDKLTIDCVTRVKQITQQIVLVSKQKASSRLFLLHVLTAYHRFPTRSTTCTLSTNESIVLDNCRADLYVRTFASSSSSTSIWSQLEEVSLLTATLCLRHALEWRRTIPSSHSPGLFNVLTTTSTELEAISFPPSFWRWMGHYKKVYSGEPPIVRTLMKTLMKQRSTARLSLLLSSHGVVPSFSDFFIIIQHYELFLNMEQTTQAISTRDSSLFFMDK